MNGDQFDNFTRRLGTGVSRRDALKLLGAIVGGGLLETLGIDEVLAAPSLKCPACGSGTEIHIDTINGTSTSAPCTASCFAAELCSRASKDKGYKLLAKYLRAHDLVSENDTEALIVNMDGQFEGTIIGTSYTNKYDSTETATLFYKENAIGEAERYVMVFRNDAASYSLLINAKGRVVKILPPAQATDMTTGQAATSSSVSAISPTECSVLCTIACTVATHNICRVIVGFICSPTGIAIPACWWVFNWEVCFPLRFIICREICNQNCPQPCGGPCPACYTCPENGTQCEPVCNDNCPCGPCEHCVAGRCVRLSQTSANAQGTICCDPPENACDGPFGGCCTGPELCCNLFDSAHRDIGKGCCYSDGICIGGFCCPAGSVALCTYSDPISGTPLYACAPAGQSCCGSTLCTDGLDTCCGNTTCCRQTQGGVCCGTNCCYPPFTCVNGQCVIN